MTNELFQYLNELILENAGLTLKLQAYEAEIGSLKSANERLVNGLLTVTEKLEKANNEMGRLDMVMKHHWDNKSTIPNGIILQSCPPKSDEQQTIADEVLAVLESDQLDFPVLPAMALKVRNLIDDPDSSADQFVQSIPSDLSISLCIIKAANCAALSNGHPVDNLYDAIPRLDYQHLPMKKH